MRRIRQHSSGSSRPSSSSWPSWRIGTLAGSIAGAAGLIGFEEYLARDTPLWRSAIGLLAIAISVVALAARSAEKADHHVAEPLLPRRGFQSASATCTAAEDISFAVKPGVDPRHRRAAKVGKVDRRRPARRHDLPDKGSITLHESAIESKPARRTCAHGNRPRRRFGRCFSPRKPCSTTCASRAKPRAARQARSSGAPGKRRRWPHGGPDRHKSQDPRAPACLDSSFMDKRWLEIAMASSASRSNRIR